MSNLFRAPYKSGYHLPNRINNIIFSPHTLANANTREQLGCHGQPGHAAPQTDSGGAEARVACLMRVPHQRTPRWSDSWIRSRPNCSAFRSPCPHCAPCRSLWRPCPGGREPECAQAREGAAWAARVTHAAAQGERRGAGGLQTGTGPRGTWERMGGCGSGERARSREAGSGVHRGLSKREQRGAGARGAREWPLRLPRKLLPADLGPPGGGSARVSSGPGDWGASTPNVRRHSFGGRQDKGQGASRASSSLRTLCPAKRQQACPCHRTFREQR